MTRPSAAAGLDALIVAGPGGSVSYELRMRAGRGAEVWVSVAAFPLDLPNQPIVLQIEDVSDRRRALLALGESEERFRAVANSAPVGVFVTGADGRVVYRNQWISHLLGTPDDGGDALKHWTGFVHEHDRDRVQGDWRASDALPTGPSTASTASCGPTARPCGSTSAWPPCATTPGPSWDSWGPSRTSPSAG